MQHLQIYKFPNFQISKFPNSQIPPQRQHGQVVVGRGAGGETLDRTHDGGDQRLGRLCGGLVDRQVQPLLPEHLAGRAARLSEAVRVKDERRSWFERESRFRIARVRKHAERDALRHGRQLAPVVPGFTTQTSKLEATIKACADHDAAFMGANVLYLKGGTKDHFMGFLRESFPEMAEGYRRLYPGAYAAPEYVRTVRALIDMLQERHDLARRTRKVPATGAAEEPPQQNRFAW